MEDGIVPWLFKRQEKLAADRANFESEWHVIAERVIPRLDDMIVKRAHGVRRDQYVFDSTAPLALPVFAAALTAMLTPRGALWHTLRPKDPSLRRSKKIKMYLEDVRDILFDHRYAATAGFSSQTHEVYISLGAFGTGTLAVEDGLHRGLSYQAIPLSENYISQNAQGLVDSNWRKFQLTARQAAQRYREALPEKIRDAVEKEPEKEFDFLHCVFPNTDYVPGQWGDKGKPWQSFEVSYEGKQLLRSGGYFTNPFKTTRHITVNREVYGRSPAQDALADIRMLNAMSKTSLRYGERSADPTILTADVDSLSPFGSRPGGVNAGYVDSQGRVLAHALQLGGNPNFTLELMDQRRQAINRSFLVTLFQILVETPRMTATEVLERLQEKGALLAPTMDRQEQELLDPTIDRELDILHRAGKIPPPPPDLVDSGGVQVAYDNPYTQARKSHGAASVSRLLESAAPLGALDPKKLRRINGDEALQVLADGLGVPARVLYSDEQLAAMDAQEQQQQDLANLLTAAPIAAQTAKDAAQAQATVGKAPF